MRVLAFSVLSLLILATGCVISPRRFVTSGGGGTGGGSDNGEFTMTVTPSAQSVTAGNAASYVIDVEPENGFAGTVVLSASPSGSVSASANPSEINVPGNATVAVATFSTTPVGTSSITVSAQDPNSGASQSITVTLNVQSATSAASDAVPGACVDAGTNLGIQRTGLAANPDAHGFIATFDATPSTSGMDSVIGLLVPGTNQQQVFNKMIHFSPGGVIEASDGDSFSASSGVPYAAGDTYHFRLVENLPAATYSLFVTPPSGTEVALGPNLQAPSNERGASTITGWGTVTASPNAATLEVCNFALH
jgi:hypothetical protein